MNKLGKRLNSIGAKGLESKEGERRRLPSSSVDTRSPSLEFNPNNEFISEDAALDYLAEILVEIHLHNQHADRTKKSSDLLPSINQGAG